MRPSTVIRFGVWNVLVIITHVKSASAPSTTGWTIHCCCMWCCKCALHYFLFTKCLGRVYIVDNRNPFFFKITIMSVSEKATSRLWYLTHSTIYRLAKEIKKTNWYANFTEDRDANTTIFPLMVRLQQNTSATMTVVRMALFQHSAYLSVFLRWVHWQERQGELEH